MNKDLWLNNLSRSDIHGISSMDFQISFFIALALLLGAVFYIFFLYRDRDKLLFSYKPLKKERDKLSEELERLKKHPNPNAKLKSDEKEDKKASKREDDKNCSENKEKIKELKGDIAKLKEENYRLKNDNKGLRQELKDHTDQSHEEQQALVQLREEREDFKTRLENAQRQLSELESAIKQSQSQSQSQEEAQKAQEQGKALEQLERDKQRLSAQSTELRTELAELKRNFNSAVAEAKQDFTKAQQDMRKELNKAQRRLQQSKKRADNNHQVFLMARAQVKWLEAKIQNYEPNFQSKLGFAVNDPAIDEFIKKFNTMDARENRASFDSMTKDRELLRLQKEVQNLKAKQQDKGSGLSLKGLSSHDGDHFNDDTERDDSLSELISGLDTQTKQKAEQTTSALAGLDLLSEEGWEEL